jgi:hypothetical protein
MVFAMAAEIERDLISHPTFKGPGGTTRFLLGRRAEL